MSRTSYGTSSFQSISFRYGQAGTFLRYKSNYTGSISTSEASCLINLSAATPLQAAVAQQVALDRTAFPFVIHPDEDTLLWLTPPPNEQPPEDTDLADTLSLESYFALYGHELVDSKYRLGCADVNLEKLAGQLVRIADNQPAAIHALNWAGSELDHKFISKRQISPNFPKLLDFLNQSGMATCSPDGRIDFGDADNRFFLCGGWLEVWLLRQVAGLSSEFKIQDAASGVRIASREGVKNEYDLAMLINNQLYVVECKTILPNKQKGVGMDVIFKLDSVAQLGGLQAHAMLIALSIPSIDEEKRAKLQDLQLINGSELLQIRERLRNWIKATS